MDVTEDLSGERQWLAALAAAVAALAVGSLALPDLVYDNFIWKYFWGPVYSDAHSARCAVRTGSGIELYGSDAACRAAADAGAVAYTGYTTVSEVGYIVTLLFMLVGVLHLLDRIDVEFDHDFFLALVPFMLFGGAFRVVEDAFDAAPEGASVPLSYPLNTLVISPIIYVTVFVITVAALLASIRLADRDVVEQYQTALAGFGWGILAVTLLSLFGIAFAFEYVRFYPQILLVDVVGATAIAYGIYRAIDAWWPEVHSGTGVVGFVVLWGHAIDGVANVIAADWTGALGHPLSYGAKHPANRIIISITEGILPGSIASVIGTSWPFLLVKMVVAVGIIYLFNETFIRENPRYAYLLLIAAVAVGMGPGTRDVLRVTFAI